MPRLLRDARRQPGLVASGAPVTRSNAESVKRAQLPWQKRALVYYKLVPEISYAGGFYSRHMSKAQLRVEMENAEGEWVVAPADSDAAMILSRMQDEGGGRSSLLSMYGRLRFLIGECYLVCFDPDLKTEWWEVLSPSELRPAPDGKTYERIKGEGFQAERLTEAPDDQEFETDPLPNTSRVFRLWRRDPEYSMNADSSMRAVMDVCEELLLLTLAVRAQARSRIAKSGILKIPSEISPPVPEPRPGEDPREDPFMRALYEHMERPLQNDGDPSSLVPLGVRGPAAYLDKLDQLQLHVQGADYPEAQLRQEAISRLATGLDMPREALLGTADVNHWGAWQIDQQTWSAHVQPVLEEMCEEWSTTVLRPTLIANGMTPAEARKWRVWYDPVKIVNHPDRGKDAQDTFDRGELSGEALREAKGFEEADAPSDAERARWVGVRVRDAGLAWLGKPTLRAGAEPEGGTPLPTDDGSGGETPPDEGGTGADTTVGAPNGEVARLLGAAEAALLQCRQKAGARIISRVGRTEGAKYRAVPAHEVYARLTPADWDRLASQNGEHIDPSQLVRGGTEAFEHCLQSWGYPPERVQALAEVIRRHAASTLGEPQPPALPTILLNL